MESLDNHLRTPGLDATPRPLPAAPTPSEGSAFADLLARAETPEPERGPDAPERTGDRPQEPTSDRERTPSRETASERPEDTTPARDDESVATERTQDDEARVENEASTDEEVTVDRDASSDDAKDASEDAPDTDPSTDREGQDEATDDASTQDTASEATSSDDPVASTDDAPAPAAPLADTAAPEASLPTLVDPSLEDADDLGPIEPLPVTETDAATEVAEAIVSDPFLAAQAVGATNAEPTARPRSEASTEPLISTTDVPAEVEAAVQAAGLATAATPLADGPLEGGPTANPAAPRAEGTPAPNGTPVAVPTGTPIDIPTDAALAATLPTAEGDLAVAAPTAGATGSTGRASGAEAAQAGVTAIDAKDVSVQRTQATATRAVADPEALQRAEQVLDQLRVKLSPKLRQATLTLRPSELGRLSVQLQVDGGKLSARMVAEQPDTLAVLQQHIPELKALLEQRGLEVQQIDLGLAQDGTSFDLNAGTGDREQGDADDASSAAGTRLDEAALHQDLTRQVASEDGLDLYA